MLLSIACFTATATDECNASVKESCPAASLPLSLRQKLGSSVLAFAQGISPANLENFAGYLLVSVAVTLFLTAVVVERETSLQKKKRRIEFEKIFAGLTQVIFEHKQVSEKMAAYNEKKEKLRAKAKQMAAAAAEEGTTRQDNEDDVFEDLVREHHDELCGGEDKEPPVRITPKRFFEVVASEPDGCVVSNVPNLKRSFSSEQEREQFYAYFMEAAGLLREAQLYKIEKEIKKTAKARGQSYEDGKVLGKLDIEEQLRIGDVQYSSGLKLEALLEEMKWIDSVVRPKNFFGKKTPMEGETKEAFAHHKATLKIAKDYLNDIRKGRMSRVARLLSYLDRDSYKYLAMQVSVQLLLSLQWPIWTYFESQIVKSAQSPNWAEEALKWCVGFWVIDTFHMLVLHNVRIVGMEKLNARFGFKIKQDLFSAILRQDMVFFKTHDSGAIQSLLKQDCSKLAHNFFRIPQTLLAQSSEMLSFGIAIYMKSPLLLWRSLGFTAFITPIIIFIFSFANKTQRAVDRKGRSTSKHRDEMLRNVQTVREFAREGIEMEEYEYSEYSESRQHIKCHLLGHGAWVFFVIFARGAISMNQYKAVELVQLGTLEPVDILFLCN